MSTFGSQVGSVHQLKKQLEKNSGGARSSGDTWIRYIPKDHGIVVRFLMEPDGWVVYNEAWDPNRRKSYPVPVDTVVPDEQRVSQRYLAQAVDTENDRVVPLCLPKSLMSQVVARYEKYGTITDRDYELSKTGTGLDTTYMMDPEPPLARKLDKYDLLDLEEVLMGAYNNYAGTDEDDDSVPVASTAEPPTASLLDEEDDEDEVIHVVPDSEEDAPVKYSAEDLSGKPIGELRAIARDLSISPRGMSVSDLIDAITGSDGF